MEFLNGSASLNLSARITKSFIYYCEWYILNHLPQIPSSSVCIIQIWEALWKLYAYVFYVLLTLEEYYIYYIYYIIYIMRFLQVSYVKCSTGKGSYYRRVKLFCCGATE